MYILGFYWISFHQYIFTWYVPSCISGCCAVLELLQVLYKIHTKSMSFFWAVMYRQENNLYHVCYIHHCTHHKHCTVYVILFDHMHVLTLPKVSQLTYYFLSGILKLLAYNEMQHVVKPINIVGWQLYTYKIIIAMEW